MAGDGDQAVVYLADLGAHLHQFLMSLDTSQGFGLFVRGVADVLPLAGAEPALSSS